MVLSALWLFFGLQILLSYQTDRSRPRSSSSWRILSRYSAINLPYDSTGFSGALPNCLFNFSNLRKTTRRSRSGTNMKGRGKLRRIFFRTQYCKVIDRGILPLLCNSIRGIKSRLTPRNAKYLCTPLTDPLPYPQTDGCVRVLDQSVLGIVLLVRSRGRFGNTYSPRNNPHFL